MSKCVVAAYTKDAAELTKQAVERFMRLRCKYIWCDGCNGYHVVYSDEYAALDTRHHAVLERLALGLRDEEIARDLHITSKQVEHCINRMVRRLNAFSRPNLVAIAIGLNIVNPSAFISEIKPHAQ